MCVWCANMEVGVVRDRGGDCGGLGEGRCGVRVVGGRVKQCIIVIFLFKYALFLNPPVLLFFFLQAVIVGSGRRSDREAIMPVLAQSQWSLGDIRW